MEHDWANDLRKYLARPITYTNGSFSATTRTQIVSYSIDYFALPATWIARMSGILGYRLTLVFRLQINANPFQAGVLRLVWQPEADATSQYSTRHTTANGVSQLPGVELDICEATSCVLKIPYIRHNNYVALNDFTGAGGNTPNCDTTRLFGRLTLFSYLPLTVPSGSPAPNYTLWLHAEDVELVGASPSVVIQAVPQSPDPAAHEAQGPISSALSRGARIATTLGRHIPSISSYTGIAAWSSRLAAGLASTYGWSKPQSTPNPQRMLKSNTTYQWHTDGPDTTLTLAAAHDNHVPPLPGFAGSDVDEMSLAYGLGQWALICNGTLNAADLGGQLKYGCPLTPTAMWYNATYNRCAQATQFNTHTTCLTTPACYYANAFTNWRGSFEFRIKIAKTKFHTGRLLLSFVPLSDNGFTAGVFLTPTILGQQFDWKSSIWDLREGNSMQFTCPYQHANDYLKVGMAQTFPSNYGNFLLHILDPLQAPSSVAQNVPFAIEVRCLPDFELTIPNDPIWRMSGQTPNNIIAQGPPDPSSTIAYDTSRGCMGEHILSIKQLISRACLFAANTDPNIQPWYETQTFLPTYASGTWTYPPMPFTAYFANCFAYARGGTVVDGAWTAPNRPGGNTFAAYFYDPSTTSTGLVCGANIIDDAPNAHIRLPYYHYNNRHLVNPIIGTLTDLSGDMNMGFVPPAGTLQKNIWSIRAADDSQMGYFLGTPPLDFSNTISPISTTLETIVGQVVDSM